jgi:riboflavin kinase/FMN adenylyltransferase
VLLQRTRDAAALLDVPAVAVTFDRHPLEVVGGRGPLPLLLTVDEKVALLAAEGMAQVRVLAFTPEFAAQEGQRFVDEVLLGELGAAHVVVGHDFRFGHRRSCGVDELRLFAGGCRASVEAVEPVRLGGERVSSRTIREHLAQGDVAGAAHLLGRPYQVRGTVVTGRRMGRTLGFPTANLRVDARKLLPAVGVYAVTVGELGAVLNIGCRPTLDHGALSVEAHVLDFSGDLYGQELTVAFVARLRDERRFDSLEALQAQIHDDCRVGRHVLETGELPM